MIRIVKNRVLKISNYYITYRRISSSVVPEDEALDQVPPNQRDNLSEKTDHVVTRFLFELGQLEVFLTERYGYVLLDELIHVIALLLRWGFSVECSQLVRHVARFDHRLVDFIDLFAELWS
jgi:hypothetical protein